MKPISHRSERMPRLRTILACLSGLLLSAAAQAVPPPPVPASVFEAARQISAVRSVIGGTWKGRELVSELGLRSNRVEVQAGNFGDSNSYLLIDRILSFPQGPQGSFYSDVHMLSVLFYSDRCHGFKLVRIDKPTELESAGDCAGAFRISVQNDRSAVFVYPKGGQLVRAQIKDQSWSEDVIGRADAGPGTIRMHRVSPSVPWAGTD